MNNSFSSNQNSNNFGLNFTPPSQTQLNFGAPTGGSWRDGNGQLHFGAPGTGATSGLWKDGNGQLQFGTPTGLWTSQR